MTAAITDLITSPSNGTRPVSTTVSVSRSTGGTSLSCADLTGWATATAVHFVTYKIDGQGAVVAGSQADWKGIVSGTTINNLVLTGGTDAGNSVGDIVEILPTARWGKELTDAMLVTSNTDGTLKTGIVSTAKLADTAVTTAKLADAAVTASKIDFTTYSTKAVSNPSYQAIVVSNATWIAGVPINITVSTSGILVVTTTILSATASGSGSFTLSGANTLAVNQDNGTTSTGIRASVVKVLTGLNPGSTTITPQAQRSSGTGTMNVYIFNEAFTI